MQKIRIKPENIREFRKNNKKAKLAGKDFKTGEMVYIVKTGIDCNRVFKRGFKNG